MKMKKINRNRQARREKWFRRELAVIIAFYFLCANSAFANPYGAQIVNGNVSIQTQGNTLNITNSPNSIINWQGFSIGANELTRFIQQNSSSAVLNRVVGQDPSAILGALQSNGRVFLVNPNGVLFGQGARIDVNGLIASTLNISNADFLSGKYNFTAGLNPGAIKNSGTINTPAGGQVYLIAPDIENTGIINAPGGDVLLAAGHSVELIDSADPFISVVVSAPENKAVNLGQIVAQSGRIGIYGGLIKQGGIVNANSAVVGEGGKIFFKALKDVTLDAESKTSADGTKGGKIKIQSETDTTMVSGMISSAGSEDKGGEINILGNQVGLSGNALIDASGKAGGGTVLIGGDYQGKNTDIQNATATYVGKDASIRADAGETGDGGKVIVWSDEATRVYGAVSARGGLLFGDGGFIETSGAYLDVNGIKINARAANGKSGTWLLDPRNVTVQSSAGTLDGQTPTFIPGADDSTIANSVINTALNNGTNVYIDTGSTGEQDGNITIGASINKGMGTSAEFQLWAAKDIFINNSITNTSSGGSLLVNMYADTGSITGAGILGGGQDTFTDVVLNAATGINLTGSNTANTIDFINRTSGNIYYKSSNDVTTPLYTYGINNQASGGTVTILSDTGDIQVGSASKLGISAKGDISLTAGTSRLLHIYSEVQSENGNIIYSADKFSATGATIIGGTSGQYAEIKPVTSARAIEFSSVADNTTLNISNDEIGSFFTPLLKVGNSSAGNITFKEPITFNALSLSSAGTITQTSSGALTITETLHIPSAASVNFKGTVNTVSNLGAITAPGGFELYNGNTGLTVTGAISTTDAPVYMNLGTGTYGQTNVDIATGSGNITIIADDVVLGENTGNNAFQTTGILNLKPFSTGRDIALGVAGDGTAFSLSASELGYMNAALLRIGDLNAGNVNIGGAIAPSGADRLSLKSGGNITQVAAGTITAGNLAIEALGDVALDTASNSVTNLAAQIGNETNANKNFKFKNASALNIGSNIDGLTGIGIYNNGVYDPLAQNGVIALKTESGAITQSAGALLGGKAVAAEGYDGVTLTEANPTGVIAGNSNSGVFEYKSANSIDINSVSGVNGIAAAGDMNIYSTTGDILVNKSITWSANKVTLDAYRNIEINQELFGSGTAKLYLYYGQGAADGVIGGTAATYSVKAPVNLPSGNNFLTKLGSAEGGQITYYVITSLGAEGSITGTDLQGMSSTGNYALGANIDASATSGWNSGAGFEPIVNYTGTFDGLGRTIGDLYINRPETDGVGLFGSHGGMDTLKNVYLVNVDITGKDYVGALVGNNTGTITGSSVSGGTVTGTFYVGGLVGYNSGTLQNSFNTASVSGNMYVGGLVGTNEGTINNSNSWSAVSGDQYVGGLVGYNDLGTVTKSYSIGAVSGASYVGGLIGSNYEGSVSTSFWDTQTSGQATSAGGTGKTTVEMKMASTYTDAGWSAPWIIAGGSYACLPGQDCSGTPPPPSYTLLFTADNKTKTYGDANYFTSTVTGYVDGDTAATAYTGAPSYALESENAGYWMITVSQGTLGSPKYGFTFAPGYMTINKALLTINAPDATKIYDGTLLAEGTPTVSGLKFSDTVSGLTAAYKDKNAGTDKTVTVSGYTIYDGNFGGNYNVTIVDNNTGVITAKEISVTGITANNKVYDGTTTATVDTSMAALSGVIETDTVSVSAESAAGEFDNKNVGTGKTVTVNNLDLTGTDKDNYKLLATDTTTTADITPKEISVTGITASNKVYDGTTTATLNTSGADLAGVIETDTVSVSAESAAGEFDNKNVGDGKAVTVNNLVLTGTDKDNYMLLDSGAMTTGNITPKNIEVTGITVSNKVYDGTVTATLNASGAGFSGVISGDEVNIDTASLSGLFDDKNAGTGKTVKLDGLVGKSGADAGNYIFDPSYSTTADITPAPLTLQASTNTKIYDGTTSASAIPVITSGTVMSGDTIIMSEVYADKHAGSGKTLTPSATIDDGNGGNNYNVTALSDNTGVIDKASLTIAATSYTKTYDGTMSAGTPAYSGLQAGDTVTGVAQNYNDKNAGSNKSIVISGDYAVNDGNGGNNYNVTTISTETAGTINQAPLTVIADDKTKYYGDANPILTATLSGFVGGETLATSSVTGSAGLSTAATESSNVGSYGIAINNGTLASGNNYYFSYFADGRLTINKAPLSIIADNKFKLYGEQNPALTASYAGFKLGQSESVLGGSLSLVTDATKESPVGPYKITPSGQTATNYEIAFVDGTLMVKADESVTQNSALVTATNEAGKTETVVVAAADTDKGKEQEEEDKDKDKKGDTSQSKEGQDSGSKKQSLPYCN
jgi:filamentous hemagglutinin family protein